MAICLSEQSPATTQRGFSGKSAIASVRKVSQVSKIRGADSCCYGDEVADWSEEVFALLKSRLDKEYSV